MFKFKDTNVLLLILILPLLLKLMQGRKNHPYNFCLKSQLQLMSQKQLSGTGVSAR